jgi:hypothetical protein
MGNYAQANKKKYGYNNIVSILRYTKRDFETAYRTVGIPANATGSIRVTHQFMCVYKYTPFVTTQG